MATVPGIDVSYWDSGIDWPKVRATGQWTDFVTDELGTLDIARAGKYTLTVKANTMPGYAVMNLKAVTLNAM